MKLIRLLDLLFPPRCLGCRKFLGRSNGSALCEACRGRWPELVPPYCDCCARPFDSTEEGLHRCGMCLEEPRAFEKVYALGTYRGVLHDLIVRMKYRSEERLGSLLGEKLSEKIPRSYDLIVPVPLHRSRLRERGFNQAVVLARAVGKNSKIPVDPFVLIKKRPTSPQAGLTGEERRRNLKGAFGVRDSERIRQRKILLIDDVLTTGATAGEAAGELLREGADLVEVAVVARAL